MTEKVYVCRYKKSEEKDLFLAMDHKSNTFLLVGQVNRALKGVDRFTAKSNLEWVDSDKSTSLLKNEFEIIELTIEYRLGRIVS